MGWMIRSALAASVAVAVITGALAAAPQTSNLPPQAASPSLDAIVGKKLISIDGSAVTLTALEGTLVRETIAANGAMQKMSFHFLTNQLGTVTDLRDPNKPLGVFRMGKRDVAIQYADGGYEAMLVNAEGGLVVESRTPQASAVCSAWYPEGHVFSMDERKEAVAQFANRLGVAEGSKEAIVRKASPACAIRGDLAIAPDSEGKPLALGGSGETLVPAGLGLAVAATAPNGTSSNAPAFASALAVAQSNRSADSKPKQPPEASTAGTGGLGGSIVMLPQTATPPQRGRDALTPEGASKCLSVESERGYRGFRNYCAYPVQFAYCVVSRRLEPASCQYGAVQGSTEAWGFSAIGDGPLNVATTPIELRWIACRGRSGDVLPRLEQIDPPSGHCVAVGH